MVCEVLCDLALAHLTSLPTESLHSSWKLLCFPLPQGNHIHARVFLEHSMSSPFCTYPVLLIFRAQMKGHFLKEVCLALPGLGEVPLWGLSAQGSSSIVHHTLTIPAIKCSISDPPLNMRPMRTGTVLFSAVAPVPITVPCVRQGVHIYLWT